MKKPLGESVFLWNVKLKTAEGITTHNDIVSDHKRTAATAEPV